MAQLVKNLPAIRETWVRPPGWEDFPGEGNGLLAWRILWTKESDTTERLSLSSFPLLEAHSASVHGVLFLPWDPQTLQPAHYHLSPWNFQPLLTDLVPSSIYTH